MTNFFNFQLFKRFENESKKKFILLQNIPIESMTHIQLYTKYMFVDG